MRGCECRHTTAGQQTPPLPELPPRTSQQPGRPRAPRSGTKLPRPPRRRGARRRRVSSVSLGRDSVPRGLRAAGGPGKTRGPAPAALAPRPRRRSPVQHFADPLAYASPGGRGQAAAATAALGRQVLDGGHHMVRRGRRWRLQLLLRRLRGDHHGGGGGAAAIRTQPGASCAGSGPGNAQRTRPGGRGPGRRRCLRSGEAGRYPRLRPPPPPPSPPLTPLPSRCAPPLSAAAVSRPGSSRAASPSPGTPREVAGKGVAHGRRAARRLSRPPRREGMGLRALPSLPAPRSSPGERRSCAGAASACPPLARKAAVCVSQSERPRVNPESRAGAPRRRRRRRRGARAGTRALRVRQRALPRRLVAPTLSPGPPEALPSSGLR